MADNRMDGAGVDGDRVLVGLEPFVQPYDWGSISQLAAFLQTEPTGRPMAEAWFGVHPAGPTTVAGGNGRTLADLVSRSGQTVSFLLKVLSIDAPLSLQLHPTVAQAREGFAEENALDIAIADPKRVFRDENHKPELICALTELDALCGFRDIASTESFLRQIGGRVADSIATLLSSGTSLREIVRRLLTPGDPLFGADRVDRIAATQELVDGAALIGQRDDPGPFRLAAHWIERLGRAYPGDGGVAVAALLNCVRVSPGDALFLAAGNMHAYLHGLGIEIMANSDNVVRGGLTSKHIAIDVLTELVDVETGPVPLIHPEHSMLVGGVSVERWPVPVRDFSLIRLSVRSDDRGTLTLGPHPAIVLCSDGELTVTAGELRVTIAGGHALYASSSQVLSFSGYGECFVASSTET